MKYLKQIFNKWFCVHDWKLYNRTNVYNKYSSNKLPYAIIDTLQCKKCGKFKQIEI